MSSAGATKGGEEEETFVILFSSFSFQVEIIEATIKFQNIRIGIEFL